MSDTPRTDAAWEAAMAAAMANPYNAAEKMLEFARDLERETGTRMRMTQARAFPEGIMPASAMTRDPS